MCHSIKVALLCSILFSAFGMKRVCTYTEDLGDTAQFRSESPCISPQISPRTSWSAMEEVPRTATSFMYALMNRYEVHGDFEHQRYYVDFPDYMESKKDYSLPLGCVSDWVRMLRKNAHLETEGVSPVQINADLRDLQHARKQLCVFILCRDLLGPHILKKQYSQLLMQTRRLRLDAFERKDIQSVIACKYHSVQYYQLPHTESSASVIESVAQSKSGSCFIF